MFSLTRSSVLLLAATMWLCPLNADPIGECNDTVSCHIDLLYWELHEKSVVLTNETSPLFFTDDFTEADVIHPHFDWNFGYRIGIDSSLPCCLGDLALEWTHYNTQLTQHRSTNSNDLTNVNHQQGMFPIWALSDDIIAGDYVTKADLRWKFKLNILDLTWSRSFFCNDCLELKPYIGLRSAWVRQHADIHYLGGIFLIDIIEAGVSLDGSDHIRMKNDFWGLGPRLGVAPQFNLPCGFSLFGDAAISGLCGVFNIRQKETYLGEERFHRHKHLVRLRWVGDLAAGIAWRTCLCQGRYSLFFSLGWEYHIFFDQIQLKRDAFRLAPHDRNCNVQGITFSGGFEF